MNIHLFFSPILNESRLEKEIETLYRINVSKKFLVIGMNNSSSRIEKKGFFDYVDLCLIGMFHFKYKPSFFRKILIPISLIIYMYQVFLEVKKMQPNIISIHNPFFLPIAFLAKKKFSKIVYVPHELEYHKTGLSFFRKSIVFILESKLVQYVDGVIVVSEKIANWYTRNYKIKNIAYAPNIPLRPKMPIKSNILREEFKIPSKSIVFIYQGVLSGFRGIDDLIEVFSKIDKTNKHLVLMGYGEMENRIIQLASKFRNIHFKPAVKTSEIINYTSSADVGIFFNSKEMTLSYKWSLPNKFYEYAISDLYIMVSSNFEEQSKLIREHNLGSVVEPTLKDLEKTIKNFSKAELDPETDSSRVYRSKICWTQNEWAYEKIYLNLTNEK